MAHLHRARLDGIQHLQPRNDLAGSEHANLKLAVGNLPDTLGNQFDTAE